MIDYFFYLMGFVVLLLLFIGLYKGRFFVTIAGGVLLLLVGIELYAVGLDVSLPNTFNEVTDANTVTGHTDLNRSLNYATYTPWNNNWMYALSALCMGFGAASLMYSFHQIAVSNRK